MSEYLFTEPLPALVPATLLDHIKAARVREDNGFILPWNESASA